MRNWSHTVVAIWAPTFIYIALADTLLKQITIPASAFAEDIKFIANIVKYIRREIQTNVDTVALWYNERFMPLSLDKCGVLQCNNQEARNDYVING